MAPVGETFSYERRHAVADLGIKHPAIINHNLTRLVDVGAVRIESRGTYGIPSRLCVLKRPEKFSVVMCQLRSPASRLIKYAGYEEAA